MKVAIAADHGGYRLKDEIKTLLASMNIEYGDFGCACEQSVDYPDYALPVAEKVAAGEFDRGILVCGTGIGMSIAANKVPGIRCALVHDTFPQRQPASTTTPMCWPWANASSGRDLLWIS